MRAIQFQATALVVGGAAQQGVDILSGALRDGVAHVSTGPFKFAVEVYDATSGALQSATDYTYRGASVSCSTASKSCSVHVGFSND